MPDDNKVKSYEIPVTLGDTDVTIIIRSNEQVRERGRDLFQQLCISRGIPNPESITIRDEEVRRILKTKGVDPNKPQTGTRTKLIIRGTIRAVQSFHSSNRNTSYVQALAIAGVEDMFQHNSNGKLLPKLRPDVAKIVPLDVIEQVKGEHFVEPEIDEESLSMSPDPAWIDENSHLEQMIVLFRAVVRVFPDIDEQVQKAGEHIAQMEAEEGGVETDSNGFQSPELD